jgi:hypothetical protein
MVNCTDPLELFRPQFVPLQSFSAENLNTPSSQHNHEDGQADGTYRRNHLLRWG